MKIVWLDVKLPPVNLHVMAKLDATFRQIKEHRSEFKFVDVQKVYSKVKEHK